MLRNSLWPSNTLQRVHYFFSKKGATFYLVLILAVGVALRLFHLTHNSLWVDEGFSIWLASHDIKGILEAAVAREDEPLYYILLHYWMYLGRSELVLRLFSVIWSTLSLVLLYRTAKLLFDPAVALTAALLLSISPADIWYAQEVGRFTLGAFLAMGSIYGFVNLLMGRRGFYWLVYVVMTAAMLYTFYMSFAIVLAQNVYLLFAGIWLKRYRDLAARWVVSQMVVVVAFLPWWPRFVEQTHHVGGVSLFVNAARFLKQLGITVQIRSVPLGYLTLLIGVGVVSLVILGEPVLALWRRLFQRPYFFVWSLPAYLALLLISAWNPDSSIRLTLIFLPPFLLALAAGLNRVGGVLWPPYRNIWLGSLILLTLLPLSANYFIIHKEDWRGAARLVEDNGRPGDAVLLHPSYGRDPFGYYYSGDLTYERVSLGKLGQDLARLAKRYRRVWLVWAPRHSIHHDPSEQLPKALETRGVLLQSFDLARIRVRLYGFQKTRQ